MHALFKITNIVDRISFIYLIIFCVFLLAELVLIRLRCARQRILYFRYLFVSNSFAYFIRAYHLKVV